VAGIVAIVFGVIGLIVGFGGFGSGHHQPDGIPWLLAGLGTGVLTCTLHAVRHHQAVPDEDRIVTLIEQRVGGARPAMREPGMATEPRPDLRP
jgi:hypothetical protein